MYDGTGANRRFKNDLRIQRNTLERLKGLVAENDENKEFHKQIDIELKRIRQTLESS